MIPYLSDLAFDSMVFWFPAAVLSLWGYICWREFKDAK
jgi:hypothetical protein